MFYVVFCIAYFVNYYLSIRGLITSVEEQRELVFLQLLLVILLFCSKQFPPPLVVRISCVFYCGTSLVFHFNVILQIGRPMTHRVKNKIEPCQEKTNVLVSDLVRHKPGCISTEDG